MKGFPVSTKKNGTVPVTTKKNGTVHEFRSHGKKYIFLEVSELTHNNLKSRAAMHGRTIKKYLLALIEADGITVSEPPRKNVRAAS